ncbi:hypothetical protein SprV_0501868100 [Sparganum proliferum]
MQRNEPLLLPTYGSTECPILNQPAVYNFADRDRIRRVYAKETQREPQFRMAVAFSVGLPRRSGGRFFQRDGFNISLPGRTGTDMEKMQTKRSEDVRNLTKDAGVNGDLVLGDNEDTYYNLSLKLLHTFQWTSLFCRLHFTSFTIIYLLDDDFAFNENRMKAELGAHTDAQIRRVTWGLSHNHLRYVVHLMLCCDPNLTENKVITESLNA